MKQVAFKNVQGRNIPLQPWPQAFYISSLFANGFDVIEVRPLTLMGLIKGVGKNFITMNWWRLLHVLRHIGFLNTEEGAVLSLHDWRWDFWRAHK